MKIYSAFMNNPTPIEKFTEKLATLNSINVDSLGMFIKGNSGENLVKWSVSSKSKTPDLHTVPEFTIGLCHGRWATCGSVSDLNAHPIKRNSTVVVHNGTIKNQEVLREKLSSAPYNKFLITETDTEIINTLIEIYTEIGFDLLTASILSTVDLKGELSFVLTDTHREVLIGFKRSFPLYLSKDEDGSYLSSDYDKTKDSYALGDDELVVITPTSTKLYDCTTFSEITTINFGSVSKKKEAQAELKTFDHYTRAYVQMLK